MTVSSLPTVNIICLVATFPAPFTSSVHARAVTFPLAAETA
ncbi:hypothetical protein [Candidatus Nitrosarchaeum limnium]|nr:hypothetical protein [Candidatus Nitrosarchaeum limnium]